jgi:hypothetical protein
MCSGAFIPYISYAYVSYKVREDIKGKVKSKVNRAKSHDEQGCQKVIQIVKNKYDPHILSKVM